MGQFPNMNADPAEHLGSCDVIDTTSPSIIECAKRLAGGDLVQTAANCFHFVRDEIKHSWDFKLNPVTCLASETLKHGTGYCYAKSHLLCSLLRANGIPAGLCYQRLSLDGIGPPFCLHGLNAIYLPVHGWYRVDARGNTQNVDVQFSPPVERLAFPIAVEREADLPGIHKKPLAAVTQCQLQHSDWQAVYENLPDVG